MFMYSPTKIYDHLDKKEKISMFTVRAHSYLFLVQQVEPDDKAVY